MRDLNFTHQARPVIALFTSVLLASLAACGGGGGGTAAGSTSAAVSSPVLEPVSKASKAAFDAQPVSVVNTTTPGDQLLRGVGPVGSGYTVAWISGGEKLFIQQYNATGSRQGGEAAVDLCIACVSDVQRTLAVANSGVAVLRDGSVAVVYAVTRPLNPDRPQDQIVKSAVYVQRFNPEGARISNESEVVSRTFMAGPGTPGFRDIRAVPLANGGFVAGWADVTPSSANTNTRTSLFVRRFDSQGQAMTAPVAVGVASSPGTATYSLAADARGGHVVVASQLGEDSSLSVSATYFDATQSTRQIALPPGTVGALLLPLAGDRFVLYTSRANGAYRQFLASRGNAEGAEVAVSSIPLAAKEQPATGFVTVSTGDSSVQLQKFDSSGQPLTDSLTANTAGSTPDLVALGADFALTWTAVTSSGKDVLTQRFVASSRPAD